MKFTLALLAAFVIAVASAKYPSDDKYMKLKHYATDRDAAKLSGFKAKRFAKDMTGKEYPARDGAERRFKRFVPGMEKDKDLGQDIVMKEQGKTSKY